MSTMTSKLSPSVVVKNFFSANTIDECFFPTVAAAAFGSRRGLPMVNAFQAGTAQLQSSQGQLTSIPGAVISFTPIEPCERGIKHGDHVNGATVRLRHCRQWGWNRLHLLEVNGDGVASGVMYSRICRGPRPGQGPELPVRWTVAPYGGRMPAVPPGYYTCDQTWGGWENKD